jgi:DNA-binding IclR family transcriptional regulator
MSAKPKSDYSIQTVSNALRMLESFRGEDELGVSELARGLQLHKNNAFRLLATLEEHGYIEQSTDNDRYRLGTRCLELGQVYIGSQSLLQRARPVLRELVLKVGETAHLAVLRDHEVVHLDGVQPDQMLLTALRVGERLPVHCTALGKVLVGCASDFVADGFAKSVASGSRFISRTDRTIVEMDKLFDELRRVADQRFALDLEECESGMSCGAAPVYDRSGSLVAAISISGPVSRLSEELLRSEIGRRISSSAEQLSLELGYSPE